jgi:hypothetical protein
MARQKQAEKVTQDMGSRYGLTELFQQGLQIFLRRLLKQKTALVMKDLGSPDVLGGVLEVGLGLFDPLGCCPFHTGPCPLS